MQANAALPALFGLVALVAACGGEANQIHDVASLPRHISVCGRTWIKDETAQLRSLDELRTWAGVEPVVVDPGFFAGCPEGPCTRVAGGSCNTVVHVRVGEDRYLSYELSGGP
jgi:hypothetical protein